MISAQYTKYILNFKTPSGTSRGVLKTKETWFIKIQEGSKEGIGECGILRGLSFDDTPDYEKKLAWACEHIDLGPKVLWEKLKHYPSIQAGVEMAFISLRSNNPYEIFPSAFTTGEDSISINGLVWMGDEKFMQTQIKSKIEEGFKCIKMKIGAIGFDEEYKLLSAIRQNFDKNAITLRVDANGGFDYNEAREVLPLLAALDIHSIEQPIAVNKWEEMASLAAATPIPIALDEELIGVIDVTKKGLLLQTINPQYIILKPSFIGGFRGSEEWIEIANSLNIGWWVTSALESNIGLNAIAQWTYTLGQSGAQGLGTGSLFTNNIPSPLEVHNGTLQINPQIDWEPKSL